MAKANYYGIFLLCWLAYLFITGITLFSRGFLLRRVVISSNSTCRQRFHGTDDLLQGLDKISGNISSSNSCWIPPRFSKSIIILIDGLRYDFASYNDKLSSSTAKAYQNQLTVFNDLIKDESRRSALLKFVADPPTTTMQRLKGLVTGSLPTFIDAGRNFASFEIEEDNIIDQLFVNKKKIVFMGDDTWTNLLPNRFVKSFPFSSFNVKDLHTVDRGIQKYLVPQIRSGDWDVIIAHFLGVDHCGHRYGPEHEAMGEKLREMNSVLKSVIEAMDNETILFVMGDHGMTKSGDHGGDSDDELDSALFIHSASKQLYSELIPSETKQVDFPPTFALLLGLPIPFGNLGKVINELFIGFTTNSKNQRPIDAMYGALATYVNLKQVEAYLEEYLAVSQDISTDDARFEKMRLWKEELENLTAQIPNLSPSKIEFSAQRMKILSTLYVRTVLEMCHQVWAQFDYLSMLAGAAMTILASLITLYQVIYRREYHRYISWILFGLSVFGCFTYIHSYMPLFATLQNYGAVIEVVVCLSSVLIYFYSFTRHHPAVKQVNSSMKTDKLSVVIFASVILLRFSNSFVVSEDSIVCYFLITLISYHVLRRQSHERKKPFEGLKKKWRFESLSRKRVIVILSVFVIGCVLRLSRSFWKCREEQWWCESSHFLQPISGISREFASYQNWRLFASVCCVISVVCVSQWLLRKAGNLNGYSAPVLCFFYTPVPIALLVSLSWILQALSPAAANIFPHHSVFIPNAVLLTAVFNLIVYFYKPLFIYNSVDETEVDEIGPLVKRDQTEIVHQVYRHLKANWKRHLLTTTNSVAAKERTKATKQPLIVYGLATLFSAPLISTSTIVVLILIMLSRDGLAPAFSVLLLTAALTLHVLVNVNDKNDLKVQNSWILVWSLLSSVGFFATGHQAVFPSIHWETGLIGTDGNFGSNILPAVKVLLNTYSSAILFGFSLPILMLWPITSRILWEKQHLSSDAEYELKRGEFLFYGSTRFDLGLLDLTSKYLWLQGTKMLSSMLAVALHRRHLMVWKIFAPKFIFEGIEFLVTVAAVLVGYLLMLRVYSVADKWMTVMENKRATKES